MSMSFGRWLLLLVCLGTTVHASTTIPPFHPAEYVKNTAECKATRRGEVEEVVDIQLDYINLNPDAPTTVLMVHGWPSLWSTWARQIQEFEEDYHLVVPDLRGFGESTHPGWPQTSGTIPDMVGDMVCVLEDAGVREAICMGHDWGSAICYEAARLRPDIFKAVVGLVVPYLPSVGQFVPIENLLPLFPALSYQLFFDRRTDEAVAELDADILRTTRATLRTVASPPPSSFLHSTDTFLSAWNDVAEIEPVPFFSAEEEEYFVDEYSHQGFENTLGFYSTKNRHQGWEIAHSQGNFTLSQPVLAIYPTQDPVGNWVMAANIMKSAAYLENLTTELLPGAHWVHIENPEETNRRIRTWFDKQGFKKAPRAGHTIHLGDEL